MTGLPSLDGCSVSVHEKGLQEEWTLAINIRWLVDSKVFGQERVGEPYDLREMTMRQETWVHL